VDAGALGGPGPAPRLRDFLARVASRELPGPVAKQVFAWACDEDGDVPALLARHGVRVQASAEELAPLVRAVLDEHPGPVAQFSPARRRRSASSSGR